MRNSFIALMVFALGAVAVSCGDDDDNNTGDPAATLASCNQFCDNYAAENCADPIYSSAAECKTVDCTGIDSMPAQCQNAMKAFYDCEKAQSDICADEGCLAELGAILAIPACAPQQ